MTGGIIWGIGKALLERSDMDPRLGRFLSKNLAGYCVPVKCRCAGDRRLIRGRLRSVCQPTRRPWQRRARGHRHRRCNCERRFHATGVRVRQLPVRPEHLLT